MIRPRGAGRHTLPPYEWKHPLDTKHAGFLAKPVPSLLGAAADMPTRKKSRLSGPRRCPKAKAQLPVDPDDAEDDLKDMPELVPESSDGESDEEVTFAEKRMTTYAKLLWGDPDWWGLTALAAHFQSTCLSTPLSAWAHRLAPALLKASVALTYVVEMPAALLCILPAVNWGGVVTARRVGAALQAAFQLAIMATGNCPSGLASSFVSV